MPAVTWLDVIKSQLASSPGKSVGDIIPAASKEWKLIKQGKHPTKTKGTAINKSKKSTKNGTKKRVCKGKSTSSNISFRTKKGDKFYHKNGKVLKKKGSRKRKSGRKRKSSRKCKRGRKRGRKGRLSNKKGGGDDSTSLIDMVKSGVSDAATSVADSTADTDTTDNAEIDNAEIDKAEIDKAEIDNGENDNGETDAFSNTGSMDTGNSTLNDILSGTGTAAASN